jgi:RES domain-containing protein
MATAWRLSTPAYAYSLDGEGNKVTGARWNLPGRPMVYTSSHLSLSVLEVFVHFSQDLRDDLPEMLAVRIHVPDDAGLSEIGSAHFERLMGAPDPLAACQVVGDKWLARGTELMLMAPSVLIPEELNLMLNPVHPQMHRVRIESSRPFRFDPRLIRAA